MTAQALVAVFAALVVSSVALSGFGLDSASWELTSGTVI